jgi:hypothetical protein
MAEIIDLAKRRPAAGGSNVRELAAVPARDLQELRRKARLLAQCRDQADALYLYAQILADIETLAGASTAASGRR